MLGYIFALSVTVPVVCIWVFLYWCVCVCYDFIELNLLSKYLFFMVLDLKSVFSDIRYGYSHFFFSLIGLCLPAVHIVFLCIFVYEVSFL